MTALALSRDQYLEVEKIGLGAFRPLTGFMTEDAFASVVADARLPDGAPFPIPIVLDVDAATARRLRGRPRVALTFAGEEVGTLVPESLYRPDKPAAARAIFGTDDGAHPGARQFLGGSDWLVGGPLTLSRRVALDISQYELTPAETRAIFTARGWRTVVGFQTRNVPHRAHEYLQRVALEQFDGLFVQPLVGRKKRGDFTPEAIVTGYRALIDRYYPRQRVVLGILSTAMRYAGPREAVFHALIRRNYGCTHFIIGRDHAGVGGYYGAYDGHDYSRRFEGELGIAILRLHGPYYCALCGGIVTDQSCQHAATRPDAVLAVSGTDMRAALASGRAPDARLMRPEVVEALRGLPPFIAEESP